SRRVPSAASSPRRRQRRWRQGGAARSFGQPGQPRALQQVLVISLGKEATLLLPPSTGLLVQFQQASDRRPGFLDLPGVGECTAEKKVWGEVARVFLSRLAQPYHRFRQLPLKQMDDSPRHAEYVGIPVERAQTHGP